MSDPRLNFGQETVFLFLFVRIALIRPTKK